ncbi:MAG: hypothetical protein HY001_03675 [Candidatus Portnoybacteria bacterium]|nr:hypothetical protein [Candidatus Portnoybacteria bacterium]
MKFVIDKKIFGRFPGLHIGVVIARGIDNQGEIEEVEKKLREEEKRIRKEYNAQTLSQHPKIEAWQKAYIAFGVKPKEHRSSVENLYRAVLEGRDVRHINKLVDIYNFISLKYMLPVGGEDLDKVKGDIVLTFAGPNEPPVLLLGDKDPRPPHEGEVIYKDDISAICRRWNWREAERTKLTEDTKNAILVIEGLQPVTREDIGKGTEELKELVEKFCGESFTYDVLDKNNTEIKT